MAYPYRGFWSLIDSVKDIQEVEKELKSRPALATSDGPLTRPFSSKPLLYARRGAPFGKGR